LVSRVKRAPLPWRGLINLALSLCSRILDIRSSIAETRFVYAETGSTFRPRPSQPVGSKKVPAEPPVQLTATPLAAEQCDEVLDKLSELREHAKCRMLSTRHEPYLRRGQASLSPRATSGLVGTPDISSSTGAASQKKQIWSAQCGVGVRRAVCTARDAARARSHRSSAPTIHESRAGVTAVTTSARFHAPLSVLPTDVLEIIRNALLCASLLRLDHCIQETLQQHPLRSRRADA